MIFGGGAGSLWQGLGVGGGPDPKEKCFNRSLIHISNTDGYISMFEVGLQ